MNVLGLVFVGTRTRAPVDTSRFAAEVLGLAPRREPGSDVVLFDLQDGSTFAVQPDDQVQERTVGFLVDDVHAAAAELEAAGVATDGVARSGSQEYVHFRGPDGRLYELVQSAPQV